MATGLNYNFIFGEKYHPLDTNIYLIKKSAPNGQHGARMGYTDKCVFSYQAGILYNYWFTNSIYIETGLSYFLKRHQRIEDDDTTLRNIVNALNIAYSWPLDTLKEENYYSNNIEVPLCIAYSKKRFSGLIGTKITLLYRDKSIYKYVQKSEIERNSTSFIWDKDFNFFYPTLKIKYLVNYKKIPLSIYLAADKDVNKHWDFQAGLEIKFYTLE
ncbi:MAG: hypothetical protein WC868_02535 [Bacteroidales bacterium]